jgi:hypothetical protein
MTTGLSSILIKHQHKDTPQQINVDRTDCTQEHRNFSMNITGNVTRPAKLHMCSHFMVYYGTDDGINGCETEGWVKSSM